MAFGRRAFLELGGFDESFSLPAAEDRDFCSRWRAGGRPMTYAPDAVIRHFHRLTPASFLRQHFHYGRGAYWFRKKRAKTEGAETPVESRRRFPGRLRLRRTGGLRFAPPAASDCGREHDWLYSTRLVPCKGDECATPLDYGITSDSHAQWIRCDALQMAAWSAIAYSRTGAFPVFPLSSGTPRLPESHWATSFAGADASLFGKGKQGRRRVDRRDEYRGAIPRQPCRALVEGACDVRLERRPVQIAARLPERGG